MTQDDAARLLKDNFAPWIQALDLTVTAIGPEGATLTMPVTDQIARVGGIVSGQALAALADTAMVFACTGHAGAWGPVATVTLDTQFLRPATGDLVEARAEVIRSGSALAFARATLLAQPANKAVVHATGTFAQPR